jgi:CheY-like chemotaxis protein
MSKILLVEDDPFIAEIYEKKLADAGFEVVNAKTGKEVLKRVAESTYDLVLLDMVLPELSGMEVLQELRSKPEYDQNLKIVVFSNLSSPEEQAAAIKAGATGFISKTSFAPSQVVDEIKRYLM